MKTSPFTYMETEKDPFRAEPPSFFRYSIRDFITIPGSLMCELLVYIT